MSAFGQARVANPQGRLKKIPNLFSDGLSIGQSHTRKGINVGVSAPAANDIQTAVQSAQSTAGQAQYAGGSNNRRSNAMAAVNTGIGAYRTAQSAQEAYQSIQSGSGFKPTVTITYGEQRNRAAQHGSGNTLTPGSIQAGGQAVLNAQGSGTQSTLSISGSDIAGKQGTILNAEGNLTLESAAETHRQHSRSREAGYNAGVALSFDGGLSLGITAGGNYGQGRGEGESTRHRHSSIGSSESRTEIRSGGHTAIHGAQVAGSSIGLESRSLSIASPQDTAAYDGQNYRLEAQVTAVYGFSASGSAEYGSIGADHRSTTLQSGLFAGDGGFQVNIKEHTDLKGGIITATEAAEQNNRNRFQTATLSHTDIENHSRYQGESYGIGMSGGMSGENLGQSQNLGGVKLYNTGAAGSGTGGQEGYSQSLGFGRDGDNRSSVTRSGIGTSNITIGNDSTGAQAQAVYTTVRSETAEQHSGRLNNTFDKERVQKELEMQREVTQQFGQNAAQGIARLSDYLGNTQDFQRAEMLQSAIEAELAVAQNPQQRARLQQALSLTNDYLADNQAAYNTWKEGGIGRSLLHAGAGGLLTGNIGGAAAAGSTSLAAPYLNRAGEHLGGAGKAVIDTVGGAAVGWLAGGNAAGAIAGANTDRFNRQLHDSEIAKIKRLANGFAKQQNISRDEAEKRLMVQAMRQVDKAYAERYAGYDQRAEAYLKANTGTFKAEGQTFTEFANMGYFNDPGKFADQKSYAAERKALNSRQEQPQADRSSRIYSDTAKTAGAGAAKGVGNWIIDNLRAPAPHYVVGGTALVQDKGEAFAYSNAVEKEIGEWSGDKLDRAAMMAGGVQIGLNNEARLIGKQIILRNNYYEVAGMKISRQYYERLWEEGRPAPFIQAREILNNNPKILPDSKPGFLRYEGSGLELIYNPKSGEIWHIQPKITKRK